MKMAYDLQEQEQLAELRALWEKYGNLVTTVLGLLLLALAGYWGWQRYQVGQAAEAAAVYEQLNKAVSENNAAKTKEVAGTLLERFARTVYAPLAALQAARVNHDSGDLAAARAQLQWVLDQSRYPEFAWLARVRLAGVLLDEKSYDPALQVLAPTPPANFAAAFADRRGDILLAQGHVDDARRAWRDALERSGNQGLLRNMIQLKLDALPAS